MRWVRLSLLFLLLATASLRLPAGTGLAPFWLFLPVLLFGLRSTPGQAALLGWSFGLAADLLSLEPFGLQAAVFAVAGSLLARLRGHLFSDHAVTQGIIAFAFTLLVLLTLLLRLEFAEPSFALIGRIPRMLLLAAVTGALLPAAMLLDGWIGITRGFREGERRVRA